MNSATRQESGRPSDETLYEALADLIDGGRALDEALSTMARVGPGAREFAATVGAALRDGKPAALGKAGMSAAEVDLVRAATAKGADAGALGPSLRLIALCRSDEKTLSAAAGKATSGPILLLVIAALLSPLPDLLSGGGYVTAALENLALLGAGAFLVAVLLPRLLRSARYAPALLAAASRLPWVAPLVRLHAERALLAAFSTHSSADGVSARALDAARCVVVWPPLASALAEAAAKARGSAKLNAASDTNEANAAKGANELNALGAASSPSLTIGAAVSESVALALACVGGPRPLNLRLRALHDEAHTKLVANSVSLIRRVAWGVMLFVSALSLRSILSHPLPGLGGDGGLGGSEMKELEHMLEGAGN